ncbi:11410_t:CDS:1 [Ambispora gerdemannii]|uniref:11410_t:CDS:1 n=1 Tax=Ambispora gerdemannii TaxID=144530 RepID=A0A9N9G7W8_9GLOM|nr:11410_t:CDS:1 [Ambispora gerdemannii]
MEMRIHVLKNDNNDEEDIDNENTNEHDINHENTNNEYDDTNSENTNNENTNNEYDGNINNQNINIDNENNEYDEDIDNEDTNNEYDDNIDNENTNNEYDKNNNEYGEDKKAAEEYKVNEKDDIENKIFPNYEKAVEEFFSDLDHGMKYDRWETYIRTFLETIESQSHEMIKYLTYHQHPQNQIILGVFYLQDSHKRQQAFQEFKKAAESNNSYGQYFLGYCYKHGIGTTDDSALAVYWLRQAVNQRNSVAYFALALHYEGGIGIKKDQKKSYTLYCKAMENGYLGALAALAYAYDRGIGVQLDTHKTIYWLRKSKKAGNAFAHVYIEAKFNSKHRF